jgi:hypothetical protein
MEHLPTNAFDCHLPSGSSDDDRPVFPSDQTDLSRLDSTSLDRRSMVASKISIDWHV